MRDPFPPASESRDYELVKSRLSLPAGKSWATPEALDRLTPPDRQRVERLARDFFGA